MLVCVCVCVLECVEFCHWFGLWALPPPHAGYDPDPKGPDKKQSKVEEGGEGGGAVQKIDDVDTDA